MSTPASELVAYKRFDARVIGQALYLHYHEGLGVGRICRELGGPSFWTIRQWVRQFRCRSEAMLQVMGRFAESVGRVFDDRAKEVFSCLRRFAVRCGVDEQCEVVEVVQPVLLGQSEQAPLFRSG